MHLEKLLQSHMDITELGFISIMEQQEAWRQSRPGRAEACESGLDSCQLPSYRQLWSFSLGLAVFVEAEAR